MNPCQKVGIAFFVSLFFLACQNTGNNSPENKSAADSIAPAISSSAAIETGKDTNRQFIRTADLKFKVKNVIQTTYDIEDIINRHDGFVTHTNLASQINNTIVTAISKDSSLETTYYTPVNTITLRVPNTKLDTTLKEIAKSIDYLDYRVIKAEDVALQLLANKLSENRNAKSKERLAGAIDTKGKKLDETTMAEEALLNKTEQMDNSKLSTLSLTDQVKFSTVNLFIYQRQAIKQEVIPNNEPIKAYQPSFGSRFWAAIQYGWWMFESLIIFLSNLWMLLILGVVAYLLYKRYKKHPSNKK